MRLIAILLLLSGSLLAAPLRGMVRGGGVPLPGAGVTATQGAHVLDATTAPDGTYAFADLPAGNWTVRATMLGFVPVEHIVTMVSAPQVLDFDLQIAPYAGPAVTATVADVAPPPAPASSPASPPPPNPQETAPALPDFAAGDANRTAAAAFAVNGSMDNSAASPFAQPAAFGNFRPGDRSLYNGGFGFTFDNSALDARSFSLTGQPAAKPGYNDLTGFFQIGGPLIIPHLLNAIHAPVFFVGYQKLVNRTVVNSSALVPTMAERGGDLTALGGPIIPAQDLSPQALALLKLYPLPNQAASPSSSQGLAGPQFNYQAALVTPQHQDSLQTRVSKNFNRQDQMAGTFNLQSTRNDSPSLFGWADTGSSLGWNSALTWRHGFSNRFFGTLTAQYSRQANRLTPYFANRSDVAAAAGIIGGDASPLAWGPPTLTFSSGIASLGDGVPLHNRNQTAAFSYAAYWNHYGHNLTFGGDVRRLEFNNDQQQNPRGAFSFNGAATGNDFGDFLLGVPDLASLNYGNPDQYFRQSSYDLFLTDDWRATSSLSLNLGMRWEYATPATERYGRLANLAIAGDFTAATQELATAGGNGSLLHPDRAGFEPRLGLAWRPLAASSLLLKAGYGIYFDTSVYENLAVQMAQQAPFSTSLSLANTPATPLTLARGLSAAPPAGATADLIAVDPNYRIGYVQTWNASLQRDLPAALVMTLSYLGNKGTHSAQRFYPNTYAPGAANPCPACPVGFAYLASNGNSTLESGKAQLQRRFQSGISAQLVYTYAHAIDDAAALGGAAGQTGGASAAAQNWLDLDAERGRSSFDQRHNLTLQAQYSTGVGVRGGALLKGWEGAAYKGWTVTTAITAGSGLPLTPVTFAVMPGTGFTGIRPDATGASLTAPPPGLALNPAAFALPAAGSFGDAGRNSINGPSEFNLNASLQRTFQLTGSVAANLRFDATNALNHVVFPTWNTVVGSAQFGLPNNANPMRSLQTTLRFTF